ncbi:MAG: glutamyl-tRNA reductase [Dehalococcoidia bacterium]|nr:glutamyl-tRNA reductase [Dehalococcoidia bacterium]
MPTRRNGESMLTMVGVSHHDAPLEVRERLAIHADAVSPTLEALAHTLGPAVILSTCNRSEVYLSGAFNLDDVVAVLEGATGIDGVQARRYLRVRRDLDAVHHLFEVAAGVDSMVIGEPEILGQVRGAFSLSTAAGSDDAVLSRLFHVAIRVGRRARAETGISRHAISLSSVAVHEALAHYPDVSRTSVLVIGAGDAGRAAAEALVDRGVARVEVINRTLAHAEALAADLGGTARPFDMLIDALAAADVVIAATGAAGYVVGCADLQAALRLRHERLASGPLLVFDIAVPRDFEAEARSLAGAAYRDIDDLQAVSEANGAARGAEVEAVRAIVDAAADRFTAWWRQLSVLPTIAAITERAEAMREEQVKRTLQALGSDFAGADLHQHLDVLTRSLVRQLLHDPIAALRRRGDRDDYLAAARTLFALDGRVAVGADGAAEHSELEA